MCAYIYETTRASCIIFGDHCHNILDMIAVVRIAFGCHAEKRFCDEGEPPSAEKRNKQMLGGVEPAPAAAGQHNGQTTSSGVAVVLSQHATPRSWGEAGENAATTSPGVAVGTTELEIKDELEDSEGKEHWQDVEDWVALEGEVCDELPLQRGLAAAPEETARVR